MRWVPEPDRGSNLARHSHASGHAPPGKGTRDAGQGRRRPYAGVAWVWGVPWRGLQLEVARQAIRGPPGAHPAVRSLREMRLLLTFLLVFLAYLDICTPPTRLPDEVDGADAVGAAMDGLWRLTPAQQALAAAAATAANMVWCRFAFGDHRKMPATWCAAGLLVGLSGWALRQWSKAVLADSFSYQISAPPSLLSGGPYTYLVHPGYSGIYLHLAGASMLNMGGSKWLRVPVTVATVALAVAVGGKHRVAPEERLLQSQFGDAWAAHVQARWRLLAYPA